MKRLLALVFVLVWSLSSLAQAQSLTASPATVYSSQAVTADWSGITTPTATDWIGLYALGAADNAFINFYYTNGAAAGSLPFGIPANLAGGTYELRLFANNGYTLLATSGAITVNTPPPATLSASPSSVMAGASLTAGWTDIFAPTASDWIGLYPAGAADNAFILFYYTNGAAAGSLPFGIPANLAGGTYELRLFANNGYTLLATSGAITVNTPPPATLSASPSSLMAGSSLTAGWTNIFTPTASDWIGLYAPGAADNAFINFYYTNGAAAGSLPFGIPLNLAAGTYELRLFANNGYTLLATSGAITVTTPPPATLSASPSSVLAGTSLTAAWTNIFTPTASDWVGLYPAGAADTAFINFYYTNGAAAGSLPFGIPVNLATGTYELRLFADNGYTLLATSGAITITAPPPVTLSVTPASVAPGGSVTAAWTNIVAPTGTDWIGLYAPGAADNAFISFIYTNGAAAGSLPFGIPATVAPGTYQLRLFSNNGYTRLATSANFSVGLTTKLFYIHPDHLNTPRLVADSTGTTVWRWDQSEPFGVNTPDENPSSLGAFEFPLRFPGQYSDKETNLSYNYSRDYDSLSGRYAASDFLGIRGGINTYAYAKANPLQYRDLLGLDPFDTGGRSQAPTVPGPFDVLFPGTPANDEFVYIITRIIKSCLAKKDEDVCYERWERESKDCSKWIAFGGRWVRACQDRANHRLRLCYRNGGSPDPDEPPVWKPDY